MFQSYWEKIQTVTCYVNNKTITPVMANPKDKWIIRLNSKGNFFEFRLQKKLLKIGISGKFSPKKQLYEEFGKYYSFYNKIFLILQAIIFMVNID